MDAVDDTSLHLVDDRGEMLVSFTIETRIVEGVAEYLRACAGTAYYAQVQSKLASSVKAGISQVLPYHLRQPSEAQIGYAVGIAKSLGIPVPPEVLSHRWAMHEFLDCHVPAFKAKQALRSHTSPAQGATPSDHRVEERSTGRIPDDAGGSFESGDFE